MLLSLNSTTAADASGLFDIAGCVTRAMSKLQRRVSDATVMWLLVRRDIIRRGITARPWAPMRSTTTGVEVSAEIPYFGLMCQFTETAISMTL